MNEEIMTNETEDTELVEVNEDTELMPEESETSGKGNIGLILAGIAGVATIGVALYKKFKHKKTGKPKYRLRLVRVDDDEVIDDADFDEFDEEEFDDEVTTEEE